MSEDLKTTTVQHDGETYTISTAPLDDVEALEAFEDGKWAILARSILGEAQWRTYKTKKHTVGELLELVLALLGTNEDKDDADSE